VLQIPISVGLVNPSQELHIINNVLFYSIQDDIKYGHKSTRICTLKSNGHHLRSQVKLCDPLVTRWPYLSTLETRR